MNLRLVLLIAALIGAVLVTFFAVQSFGEIVPEIVSPHIPANPTYPTMQLVGDWIGGGTVQGFPIHTEATCAPTCYYVGGTGNFSDGTHWSASSGGAACACTPGSTDTVTFDGSSGAGTATQNNATFTSGAVVMTSASVTVSGSSNTWKVGGSWSDANAHFSRATSTIEITSNGTITTQGNVNSLYIYNFTVDASVSITFVGNTEFNNVVINNNAAWSGAAYQVRVDGAMTLGTGVTTNFDLHWANANNIPSGTYDSLLVQNSATMGGAITTTGAFNSSGPGNESCKLRATLTTNGYSLTCNTAATTSLKFDTLTPILAAGASTVVVGSVSSTNAAGYITSSSSGSWSVYGSWTNSSTSASWSFSAPITFEASADQTMTFCSGCGPSVRGISGVEFQGAVIFDSTATGSTSITYTMATNALIMSDNLTVTNSGSSSGTATLDVSASNLAVKVGGNWDTSNAKAGFTKRSGTVTLFGDTNTVKIRNSSNGFYNVTIPGAYVILAPPIDVSNTLTVTGSLSDGFTETVSGYTITFTSNVTGLGTYLWNFGDLSTSTSVNPAHTYSASGTYNVVLAAADHSTIPAVIAWQDSFTLPAAFSSLVSFSTASESPGVNCSTGGTAATFKSGLDNGDGGGTANDGILQTGEVDNTTIFYTCTGATGATGTAGATGATGASGATGHAALVRSTVESAGANCTYGGSKVETAIDTNDNSNFDDAVTSTTYICDGADGADGSTGPTGENVSPVWVLLGGIALACIVLVVIAARRDD